MKLTSESPRQTSSDPMWPLMAFLLGVALTLAWPALFLGVLIGLAGKRWQFPPLAWLGLAALGLGGLWFLWLHVGMTLAFHVMIQHIPPFTSWSNLHVLWAFLPYLWPLWLRSLLVTPLFALVVHLLPKRMEERLLRQESERLSRQEQASRRAKRRVRRVPDQMKGKAILGTIIRSSR
jgi:heme exporter protein D